MTAFSFLPLPQTQIYICKMAMGKQYIIENAYIHDINVLIDDKVPQIRMNTYLALLNFCEFREGVDHYFLAELESTIIDKFSDELEVDVLILALRFFKLIMEAHASKRVIERPDCIRKLQTLLSHKNTQVRAQRTRRLPLSPPLFRRAPPAASQPSESALWRPRTAAGSQGWQGDEGKRKGGREREILACLIIPCCYAPVSSGERIGCT